MRGGVRKVAVVVMRGQVIPAAKLGVVRTQHQLVLASFLATNAVVRVRVARVPVEDKDAITSFKRNHLVAIVFKLGVLVVARHVFEETSTRFIFKASNASKNLYLKWSVSGKSKRLRHKW